MAPMVVMVMMSMMPVMVMVMRTVEVGFVVAKRT
jgi:hypothetical protein